MIRSCRPTSTTITSWMTFDKVYLEMIGDFAFSAPRCELTKTYENTQSLFMWTSNSNQVDIKIIKSRGCTFTLTLRGLKVQSNGGFVMAGLCDEPLLRWWTFVMAGNFAMADLCDYGPLRWAGGPCHADWNLCLPSHFTGPSLGHFSSPSASKMFLPY